MTNHFFLLTSSTGCLRPPSEDEQPINTSPPKGGEHDPQLRPILRWACAAYGLAYSPRRQAARGPSGDACGIVVAPMALVASLRPRIPAYQGAQVAAAWVGTSRPASWACRGATAAGNAMAKHWARVARRRDCAAFGYVVNRATSDRVQPLRFFILVGSREGCRRWPFRPWRGRESPHEVWGCNPLP